MRVATGTLVICTLPIVCLHSIHARFVAIIKVGLRH